MRIAYITAGAAGMYCGSCMHDNTLVAALQRGGHDALLIPTYTPLHTDEPDVSVPRVFFGGINVYLQQKLALFRHTPWLLDRLLDARGLLRWVSRYAVRTEASALGDLTLSVLRGEHGRQAKEVAKLVRWLAGEVRPALVNLTNVLLSGMVPELKRQLRVPVLATLQGDDVFLEALPEAARGEALRLVRSHCQQIDGFIATSRWYADFMAGYLDIPRDRIDVVYPGLNLERYGAARPDRSAERPTVGYFARVCPEKGLHNLAAAFRLLRKDPSLAPCRLVASGWLGPNQRPYLDNIHAELRQDGLAEDFSYVASPDHASKVHFFQQVDVLSVPTSYQEPKGLYVLEALANGVPVVQPQHGSFPELIEATQGGLLVPPSDAGALAAALAKLLRDPGLRKQLGGKGRQAVAQRFSAEEMARQTLAVYGKYLG